MRLHRDSTGGCVSEGKGGYAGELSFAASFSISLAATEGSALMSRLADGSRVTIAGMVTTRKNNTTKNGQLMSFVTVEDLSGAVEVIVFPKVLIACDTFLNGDNPIILRGRVSIREDEDSKIIAEEISILTQKKVCGLNLEIEKGQEMLIDRLNSIIHENIGTDELYITTKADGERHKCIYNICVTGNLISKIGQIIGKDNVKNS